MVQRAVAAVAATAVPLLDALSLVALVLTALLRLPLDELVSVLLLLLRLPRLGRAQYSAINSSNPKARHMTLPESDSAIKLVRSAKRASNRDSIRDQCREGNNSHLPQGIT